jgi:hypothetical protein
MKGRRGVLLVDTALLTGQVVIKGIEGKKKSAPDTTTLTLRAVLDVAYLVCSGSAVSEDLFRERESDFILIVWEVLSTY